MCKRFFLSLFYFALFLLNVKKYVRLYASGKKPARPFIIPGYLNPIMYI